MRALVEACRDGAIPATVALVVSNEPIADGVSWARSQSVPTVVLNHRDYASRELHDRAIQLELEKHDVELVCLAGYMRLVSPWLVRRHAGRMLNIHPSLLPAFKGLNAQQQAVDHGVKLSGATVHFVDEELDHGPIILQRAVALRDDDTGERLSDRILEIEHSIYPEAVRLICLGRVTLDGRRTTINAEETPSEDDNDG